MCKLRACMASWEEEVRTRLRASKGREKQALA